MGKDNKNIDTYETRTKVNTTKWSPIYEVIDEGFIKESKLFPDDLLETVKIIQMKQNLYRLK